ncbi:centriole, cilia and spindle-associated protein [Clupea harengus]|uniref:Centriole, cilia and spindle-associated protein n=1 Tax=Clupea harengus TaxID=7950 RepID=A0A6P3VEE5_CLUHA|nr:centriole, cilia and spindle-associated protein [Clupea harengus]XP_012669774.1 centriole, cilia and spindle-associated protein [Clupea harengus]
MVTKRIRSEYMKKFKDPKWESYSRCYEELLKYRRTRRLLEQSHNPWFWGDWASDASDSGRSTPQRNNKVEPLQLEDRTPPRCEKVPEQPVIPPDHASEPKAEERQGEGAALCASPDRDGSISLVEPEVKGKGEEEKSRRGSSAVPAEVLVPVKPKSRQHASHKPTRSKSQPRKCQDAKDTKDDKDTKDEKENKHPFALYGGGERQADMASKKTHNVCPAASTKEIHESALRAKTRREVEKQVKKGDNRRASSVDLEKMAKSKVVPDFDPWITEYMRSFSARSR